MTLLPYSVAPVGAAAFEAVSLAEAKAQARVLHDSDDDLLTRLLAAAREQVEEDAGLAIVQRTWRQTLDQFPACDDYIEIKRRPLVSVQSINYQDADDDQQTWDDAEYVVDVDRQPGAVLLAHDADWPDTRDGRNAVTINFTAGFASAAAVPERAVQAILLLAAHWYAHPEAEIVGAASREIKLGYDRLIRLLRKERYP